MMWHTLNIAVSIGTVCFVLLHQAFGQQCNTFAPILTDATDEENYVGGNFSLICAYENVTAAYVYWQFKMGTTISISTSKSVYEVDFESDADSLTTPNSGYEDHMTVEVLGPGKNLLNILAHWRYTESTWKCSVSTSGCPFGEDSNQVFKKLKKPRLITPPRLLLDGEDVCENRYSDTKKMVIYEVTSDPKSSVELSGSALGDVQPQTCEEQGDGWKCSVMATYVRSGDVACKTSLFKKETCACGRCDKEIRISDPETLADCEGSSVTPPGKGDLMTPTPQEGTPAHTTKAGVGESTTAEQISCSNCIACNIVLVGLCNLMVYLA